MFFLSTTTGMAKESKGKKRNETKRKEKESKINQRQNHYCDDLGQERNP